MDYREIWGKLGFWFAMLSLFITVNAEVFGQHDDPELALFFTPLTRLVNFSPPRTDLSHLLAPPEEEMLGSTDPASGDDERYYILAIDTSESMNDQRVTEEEFETYKPYADGAGCELEHVEGMTGFDIAKAELCRFIRIIPNGGRVAMWQFSATPAPVMPVDDAHKSRFFVVKETEGKGSTAEELVNAAAELRLEGETTNFEGLLDEWAEQYVDLVSENKKVHFVILSDFSHDIGMPDNAATGDRGWWASRYRASSASIAERFRELTGSNQIFHLTRIDGAQKEVTAVLPLIGQSLEWHRYRTSSPSGSDIDLLRPYRMSKSALTFMHAAGGELHDARIVVDKEKLEYSTLVIGVATDAQTVEHIPLRIRIEWSVDGARKHTILRSGGPPVSLNLERREDEVLLRPLYLLSEPEAQLHTLLLSWSKDGHAGSHDDFVYAVPMPFRRRLSIFGAIGILLSLIMIVVYAVPLGRALANWFSRRRAAEPATPA